MSGELTAVLIVATIFFSLTQIVRTIADNNLRKKLIDKDILDEKVKFLYQSRQEGQISNSLKWGMVLIAVGAAVLIGQYAPYRFHEEATISAMFIMAGLALIAYYVMAKQMDGSPTGEAEEEESKPARRTRATTKK